MERARVYVHSHTGTVQAGGSADLGQPQSGLVAAYAAAAAEADAASDADSALNTTITATTTATTTAVLTDAESGDQFAVPEWLPATTDETMGLFGGLPPGCAASREASVSDVVRLMKAGQRFVQYFKTSSGQQVRRSILVFYVEEPNGAGKLHWSERSRRSVSQNRCLKLDAITDIFLGAQTAVLKRAVEANEPSADGTPASDALLFSLLSDTTMLDLEATGMPQLCYWLWGLGVLMYQHGRIVNEINSADDLLNCSRLDSSMEVTETEMAELKHGLMNEPVQEKPRRRHTRKFSVMNGSLNESIHEELSAFAFQNLAKVKTMANPVAPLRNSFGQLKQSVEGELASMGAFITQSMSQLTTRARQAVTARMDLEDALATEQRKRRRLQNKLIELQGNIRVFARVRPLSATEQAEGSCIGFPGENMLSLASGSDNKAFEFDRVYDSTAGQADVFKDVAPFVQSAVDGYAICIFAYGQTGAGKSFTMEGPASNPGVNSRAMAELFDLTRDGGATRSAGYTYEVTLSVVEIYNETLRDLLSVEKTKPKLDVRQGADGVYVPDLTEVVVTNVDQVRHLMATRATPNRAVASTNMNEHSSRSHCCMFIKVTGTNGTERTAGRLVLIDLAGSERLAKSGAEGAALTEAKAINGSLSALGNVISALQAKATHVPYRDSKLTYLLSSCLSGQSKCLMFVQLSPALSSAQESSCSLQFASRARQTDLGVAKKNKTMAGGDVAALKRSMAAAKEESKKAKDESKAELTKVQKLVRTQAEQLSEANHALAMAQVQLKQTQTERDSARLQSSQTQGAAVSTLQAQMRAIEKENLALKDKMNAATATAQTTLQAKEREIRELRAKMLQPSPRNQAWEAEAAAPIAAKRTIPTGLPAATSTRRSARTASTELDADAVMDADDQENNGVSSAQATSRTTVGKKRRSNETVDKNGVVEESVAKRVATESDQATARPRTTSAATRVITPLQSMGALSQSVASARTRRQAAVQQVQVAATRVTRAARPVTAPTPTPVAIVAHVPAAVEEMSLLASPDESWAADLNTSGVHSSPSATLSVTELAMIKLNERRLKFSADRALLKKAPAAATGTRVGSWQR